MPVIPEFDQALAIPQPAGLPRANVDAAGMVGRTLQQAGAQLFDASSQIQQRYAEARRQQSAADINYRYTGELGALAKKQSLIADPDQALAGFETGYADIHQRALAENTDPLVQNYVTHQLGQEAIFSREAVRRTSFGNWVGAKAGELDQRGAGYADRIAATTDPLELHYQTDQMDADLAGSAAAGIIPREQVAIRRSHVLHTAIVLRGETDPIGAQQLLDAYKDQMTTRDLQLAVTHLQPLVYRRTAEDAAGGVIGRNYGGAGGTGGAAPDETAIGDALVQQESGTNPNEPTSVNGAVGKWQITGPTFSQYAQPGESNAVPADNEKVGRRIVHDLYSKFGGDPARIAVGYFSGPGNVAPTDSATPWIADKNDGNGKSTSSYVSDVMGRLNRGPAAPDLGTQIEQVREATKDQPFEVQHQALSLVVENYHERQSETEAQRAELGRTVNNLAAGYEQGLTDTPIPEDRIRALYPPDRADELVNELKLTQQAGLAFKAVRSASPDAEAAAREMLAVPGALAGKKWAPGEQPTEPVDQAALRKKLVERFDAMVAAKAEALDKDPAAYVATLPEMQARLKAVDPNDPSTLAPYALDSLAIQNKLGVPQEKQHVLTAHDAAAEVQRIMRTDPAKEDEGAVLDGMARQYGDLWPQVHGDLVQLGRLPADYQALSAMDLPAQAVARTELQRALTVRNTKGGIQKLMDDAPPDAVKTIKTGLDDAIAPFRATTTDPNLINTVRDAVQTLALYRAIQGQTGGGMFSNSTVQQAAADIIGSKYDIDGPTRIPRDKNPEAVKTAARQVQAGLTAADLQPIPDATGLRTPEETGAVTLAAARNGVWMANERDDGLVLMLKLRQGAMIPARHADGGRIELKFNALPQPAPEPPVLQDGP